MWIQEIVMFYTVKRVSLGSALRLGMLLGGLVSLPPALLGAGVAVLALKAANRALGQVTPITLSLLGQDLGQIDLLGALGLQTTAQTVGGLAARLPWLFAMIALLLALAGALIVGAGALLGTIGYNLLAARGWGLAVEMTAVDSNRPKRPV
jgi:hypothetical protein